jgi:hypothetical protein
MAAVLKTIKIQMGTEIFDNSVRFTSVLNDLTIGEEAKKIKNLLRIAICELGAYRRLKKAAATGDGFTVLNLAKEMTEDYMIPAEISMRVIECIAVFADYGGIPARPENAPNPTVPQPAAVFMGYSPGNIVRFGRYDWRILDIQEGKALLLCDKIIAKKPFNEILENTSWQSCSLQKYLNGEFYASFTQSEKSRISKEKIFLLSIEETAKYLGDSNRLKYSKFAVDDRYNETRKAADSSGSFVWWWLRSQGEDPDFAAYVCTAGVLRLQGVLVNISGGVRPALWLTL